MGDARFGPRQHAQDLWAGCGVERLGVATADEWSRAGRGAELAIVTAQWLTEANVAAARVRAYARALAGLDEPRPKTLAERYPDDGMSRATGRLGTVGKKSAGTIGGPSVYAPPPALEVKLSSYLGSSTIAGEHTDAVRRARDTLAACFSDASGALPITVRLVIADGSAQDGELIHVRKSGNTTNIEHYYGDPQLERCLLSRAARLAFANYAAPTTVEVELGTH